VKDTACGDEAAPFTKIVDVLRWQGVGNPHSPRPGPKPDHRHQTADLHGLHQRSCATPDCASGPASV